MYYVAMENHHNIYIVQPNGTAGSTDFRRHFSNLTTTV
jgi:hypothetical protein